MWEKVILWLLAHMYVREVDMQSKPDDMSLDETKAHTAVEIGIKGTF